MNQIEIHILVNRIEAGRIQYHYTRKGDADDGVTALTDQIEEAIKDRARLLINKHGGYLRIQDREQS